MQINAIAAEKFYRDTAKEKTQHTTVVNAVKTGLK